MLIRGLDILQPGFEHGVQGEVDGLVGPLAQGSEGDAAIQRGRTFFLEDGVERMCGVSIFGNIERVGHAVVLGLQADFDDFHRVDDGHRFRDASSAAG